MINFQKILCPTDFSDHAQHALSHAISVAKWYGSEITLSHVSPLSASMDPFFVAPTGIPLEPATREHLLGRLRRQAATAQNAGVRIRVLLEEGSVVERILARAETIGADLLVLGTHGTSGFERLVLGSITEKLLRKATCPVLTVPPKLPAPYASKILLGTILCPVDFSESSIGALEYALSLALESKAHLIVMHVVETPFSDPRVGAGFDAPSYVTIMEADARERLKKLIPPETLRTVQPEEIVLSGKASREIVRLAKERKAGAIVMGVRGRGPIDMALFGSTTNHVVRAAECAVLTIRTAPKVARKRELVHEATI